MTPFFGKIEDARSLAQIVVETVREPLLVLDNKLTILVASSSFHKAFQIDPKHTPDQLLFVHLTPGRWIRSVGQHVDTACLERVARHPTQPFPAGMHPRL